MSVVERRTSTESEAISMIEMITQKFGQKRCPRIQNAHFRLV